MSYDIPEKLVIWIKSDIQKKTLVINGQQEIIVFKPAMATDASKPKTQITARNWTRYGQGHWSNPETGVWERKPSNKEAKPIKIDNKPFSGLRIYDIDIRAEGGRAYKIITKEGWAFDVREHVMLDTMLSTGIKKGGYLLGEFVWVKERGHMKLARVGSELWKKSVEQKKTRSKGKLKRKELVRGGIYRTLSGQTEIVIDNKPGKIEARRVYLWPSPKSTDNFVSKWKEVEDKVIDVYEIALSKWEQGPNDKTPAYQTATWNKRKPHDPREGHSHFRKSHSFVEKIGQFTEDDIEKYFQKK